MRILKCLPMLLLSTTVQAETLRLNVENAEQSRSPDTARDVIDVKLDPKSRKALADFTRTRVGRQIHLFVDGHLLTSPPCRASLIQAACDCPPERKASAAKPPGKSPKL